MTVGGYYALELRCDQEGGCDRFEDFVYSSKMVCREMAREAGWLLSQTNTKFCLCPDHAEERRKRWT